MKVIYTCIIGNYDTLKPISKPTREWQYICFTDNLSLLLHKNIAGWEIRPIPCSIKGFNTLDNTRKNRAIKILPHLVLTEYTESLYLDANIKIIDDLTEFFSIYIGENDTFSIGKHPERTCIYQEGIACNKYAKENPEILKKQMDYYRSQNYPENNGLIAGWLMYRKNTEENKIFCNLWWDQLMNWSKRDQMSFNYTLWKNPIPISNLIPASIVDSNFFEYWSHGLSPHKLNFSNIYPNFKKGC